MEMRRDREANTLARQADTEKGVPDFIGSNLAYLLRLSQVDPHEDLPTVWKGTRGVPKASTSDDALEGP